VQAPAEPYNEDGRQRIEDGLRDQHRSEVDAEELVEDGNGCRVDGGPQRVWLERRIRPEGKAAACYQVHRKDVVAPGIHVQGGLEVKGKCVLGPQSWDEGNGDDEEGSRTEGPAFAHEHCASRSYHSDSVMMPMVAHRRKRASAVWK
jgi:hypothetical protein